MSDDVSALTKARRLLIIVMATCEETLVALDAVDHLLDTEMTDDLRRVIARSGNELEVLTAKLAATE